MPTLASMKTAFEAITGEVRLTSGTRERSIKSADGISSAPLKIILPVKRVDVHSRYKITVII